MATFFSVSHHSWEGKIEKLMNNFQDNGLIILKFGAEGIFRLVIQIHQNEETPKYLKMGV